MIPVAVLNVALDGDQFVFVASARIHVYFDLRALRADFQIVVGCVAALTQEDVVHSMVGG